MSAMVGGSEKAFITNVDAGSVFYVQFNPKELKLDEKAIWTDAGEQQADTPLLTYEKGQASTLNMDLVFDSTDDGSNCYDSHVKKLRAFLSTSVELTDDHGKKISRPPYLCFTWGTFNFDCVVESIGVQFLMFKPDGSPLRALVTLGLKQLEIRDMGGSAGSSVMLSAMGTMLSGGGDVSTTVVQQGETLSSIAARTGTDMRDLAAANGVDDPMNPEVGSTMVCPGNSDLAGVLEAQNMSTAPSN